MRILFSVFSILFGLGCLSPVFAGADNVLKYPSSEEVTRVYMSMKKVEPKWDNWLRVQSEYSGASEFDRDDVKLGLIQDFMNRVEAMKGVDTLILRTDSMLDTYNSQKNGFPMSGIMEDMRFSMGSVGVNFDITMENLNDFLYLNIAKKDAKALIESMDGVRSVNLEWHLKIKNVDDGRGRDFGRKLMQTYIEKVVVKSPYSHEILHEMLPETPMKEAKSYEEKPFNAKTISIEGFSLGMSSSDVKAVLKKNALTESVYGVYYHDIEAAMDDGYNSEKVIDSYNTENFSLKLNGSCRDIGSYKKNFAADENCITLYFTVGKKGMVFGGEESVINKIVQNKGLSIDKIKERKDVIFSDYGLPQHTVLGKYEKYAWGAGDGKEISSYPLSIANKLPMSYSTRDVYLSVVEEEIILK